MALALYRKYRPRTFAEVIGQEHVTAPLIQALRTGRLNHAYLFSGPRGCGKTSSARILARSLNCEKGPTPEPCGECDSCRALAPDGAGSIDVIEIDAASHGGVDDARELRERAFFAPVSSRYKVYVIDEAHMVSTQGFNALLKLVEEPPEYIKFIFATTEPEKVLGTIKSRTHHYPFRLIPPGVMRPHLEQLCASEGIAVEPTVFPLVVRAGGGSARDSQSVLDQLIAGSGDGGVTYAQAVALLGVTDGALLDEVCDALAAADGATAFAAVDKVAEAGHDPRRFASDLLERLRDLIILQQVPDAIAKGIIDGPPDELDRMTSQASHFGPATLSRMADMLHNGLTEMRGTTAPRLLLELVIARMLLPGADDSMAALLQRVERMERRLTAAPDTAAVSPTSASPPARPAAVSPTPARPTTASRSAAVSSTGDVVAGSPPVGEVAVPGSSPRQAESGATNVSGPARAGSGPASRGSEAQPVDPPVGSEVPSVAVSAGSGAEPVVAPAVGRGEPAPAGQLDVAAVRLAWDDVLSNVRRKSQKVAALARDAVVRSLDGDTVVLVVKSAALATMLGDGSPLLVEALYEQFGGAWQIRCDIGGDTAPRTGPATRPAPGQGSRADQGAWPSGAGQTDQPGGAQRPSQAGREGGGRAPAHSGGGAGPRSDADPDGSRVGAAPDAPRLSGGLDTGPAAMSGTGTAAGGTGTGAGRTGTGAGRTGTGGGSGASRAGAGPGGHRSGGRSRADAARGVGPQVDAGGSAGPAADEEDWPDIALPGGGAAGGGAAGGGAASVGAAAPGSDGPAGPGGVAGQRGGTPAVPRARAGAGVPARGAAERRAGARETTGRGAAGRGAGAARVPGRGSVDSGPPLNEPPFDPDYDPPPSGGYADYGFDPGDEPLDDEAEAVALGSSEEQALRLLAEQLGAEKIGETPAR